MHTPLKSIRRKVRITDGTMEPLMLVLLAVGFCIFAYTEVVPEFASIGPGL